AGAEGSAASPGGCGGVVFVGGFSPGDGFSSAISTYAASELCPSTSFPLRCSPPPRRSGPMNFVVTGIIVVLGLPARYAVDMSSELSAPIFLDSEPGVETAGSMVTSDQIVDMRPETAIADSATSNLPDLLTGR